MNSSKAARKDHPLRPADIQLIDGEFAAVWHNWDVLSVRNTKGEEVFSWETTGHDLIHEARLLHGHLLVTLGAGVSIFAFELFSFEGREWARFPISACDVAVAGVDSGLRNVAMIGDGVIEIWDVLSQSRIRTLQQEDPDAAAFRFDGAVAVGGYDGLSIWHDGSETQIEEATYEDICALRWFSEEELVIGRVSGVVSLFDITKKRERKVVHCGSEIKRIDCHRSRNLIAVSDRENLNVVDPTKKKTLTLNDTFGFCPKGETAAVLQESRIHDISDELAAFT